MRAPPKHVSYLPMLHLQERRAGAGVVATLAKVAHVRTAIAYGNEGAHNGGQPGSSGNDAMRQNRCDPNRSGSPPEVVA